jgi:protein-L-isoaspartate(D-aspartate) O-methyltransferase
MSRMIKGTPQKKIFRHQGTPTMTTLIQKLKLSLNLSDDIIKIIEKYDRKNFHPVKDFTVYYNRPKAIPNTKQTMSAPHIHAMTLQVMEPIVKTALLKVQGNYNKLNFNILDVGCGSGYVTATMAEMIRIKRNRSRVVAIDIFDNLVNLTQRNLRNNGFLTELNKGKIVVRNQDGWSGYSVYAPYMFINVAARADRVPAILYHQLAIGGTMLIPINGEYMLIQKIVKNSIITMVKKKLTNVRFVELIKRNKALK